MKLVLASYFEKDNHGSGRKIGISPGKPKSSDAVECDLRFGALDPGQLYWDYHKFKKEDPEHAGEAFTVAYKKQCQDFIDDVKDKAAKESKTVFELLPFQDGDTLLSWEKKGNTSYRAIAAEFLRELGYEVVEN